MKNTIYVGTPVLNCVEYTKGFLKSLKSNEHDIHLTIVDNASTDGTKEYLEEQMKTASDLHESITHLHVITNEKANSCAGSWNQIIDWSMTQNKGKYCLITNNDTIFTPHTVDNLVKFFEETEDKSIVLVTGSNIRGLLDDPLDALNFVPEGEPTTSNHPDFACFMINRTCLKTVGLFNELFKKGFFEDNNFHDRILFRNLKAVATTSSSYYHYGSITQNQEEGGIVKGPQFEENRSIYEKIKKELEGIAGRKLT